MLGIPKTRQDEAFLRIRGDILGGRLMPGQRLPFAELTATYPFSVSVLREALSRLVEQELVQSEPQRGYVVTPLSSTDLIQLTDARREIESLTLRHAMNDGGVEWESRLLAAEHILQSTPFTVAGEPHRISEEWAQAHADFHETLLGGCANSRLTAIASQLRASAELYRRWSLPLGHSDKRDIAGEHHAIVQAVLSHDPDRAIELLDAHIALTTRLLLEAELTTGTDTKLAEQ